MAEKSLPLLSAYRNVDRFSPVASCNPSLTVAKRYRKKHCHLKLPLCIISSFLVGNVSVAG